MATDVSLATGTTELLSGSIQWSGLASGVDFASVVDQLVELERTTINRLELWRSTWEEKIESVQALNTRLASLKDFVGGIDTFSEFYARTTSISDATVASATNTSTAPTGSHSLIVGSNIAGRVASRSVDPGWDVSGGGGAAWIVINIGDDTTISVDVNNGDTISDVRDAIETAVAAQAPGELTVSLVDDKDRSGTTYQRLVLTATNGGSENQITVSDNTSLKLDENSIDAVYDEINWHGSSSATSGGPYYGSTNKTFTFRVAGTGILTDNPATSDSVLIEWADNEGNSGSFTVEQSSMAYDVFQGVTVQFSSGQLITDDSFTIDAYSSTLQAAQDKGLAQAERRAHVGFIDLITPVTTADAELVYRYEGVETTVSVSADATLQDLVDAINNDPNNRGVVASIVDDGQSTAHSYHLVLTGQETGAEHSITMVSDTLTNFDASDSEFETAQRATDSMIKLDGYPSDDASYIQRSTNTVSDVIDGVVLTLLDAGSTTITISNDLDQIQENIELLVNSVNFVQEYIREETEYNDDTGESGVMLGNYSYDIISRVINEIMYQAVPGLDTESDTYVHLSQIGIKTDPDQNGIWVIETTTLSEALNNDLEAVARLFVVDEDYGSTGVADRLVDKLEELTDSESGAGNVLINSYNGIIEEIDAKITREESRVQGVRERLEEKFARLESLLSELEGQSQYIESQIDQLPSIGGS